jgi:hypothetical protein
MPKPGSGFSMTFRYPRLTQEQEAYAKKIIASWLSTLGSDGTTFRPGSLFYIAMNAGLMTGINHIGREKTINLPAALATICDEAHARIQRGQYVYHLADEVFYDVLLGDIQEEDERFDKHGGAVHSAFNAFSTVLNQDPDWIILESETMYRH